MFSTKDEALDYIYSFINLEKKAARKYRDEHYSLDGMRELLNLFGNPQENLTFIHVAGTKGKGSTCRFISRLLQMLGNVTTGFLSPHLVEVNERFMWNDSLIGDDELVSYISGIRDVLDTVSLVPTTFELFFLLYLLYSRDRQPDYCVVETGLGGRLDCTNVITPRVSVITPVSYDHMEFLGNTIEEIAREKGGIIKKEVPLVMGEQDFAVGRILQEMAYEKKAPFYSVSSVFRVLSYYRDSFGLSFDFVFNEVRIFDLTVPLFGVHQLQNFGTALTAVFLVEPDIFTKITDCGYLGINLPGRIDFLRKEPPLVVDVAHNPASIEKLVTTLKEIYPGQRWTVICGFAKTKDHKTMLSHFRDFAGQLIITGLSSFKESSSQLVYEIARDIFPDVIHISDYDEAFAIYGTGNTHTLVTGSFYLAGPFIEFWQRTVPS